MGLGFDLFNAFLPIMFVLVVLVFLFIIGFFISILIKSIRQKRKDDRSPRLTVDATVVTKRADVSHHSRGSNDLSDSSTEYYVTFQVASGDRMELYVTGFDYGMLVEGDQGKLSFQGSRFLSFERA